MPPAFQKTGAGIRQLNLVASVRDLVWRGLRLRTQFPQHRIGEGDGGPLLRLLHQFNAFMDRGMLGNSGEKIQLISGHPQRRTDDHRAHLPQRRCLRRIAVVDGDIVSCRDEPRGRIVASGGPELALELEKRGYGWIEKEPPPRPAGWEARP